MDAGIEKECSALGGLFQLIMSDMKASYPTWEDFVSKGAKLQSQLRTTILVTGAFLDAFQKVADMATGTRGATKEIGSALTRMCMRHRSIESKLKLFTTSLSECLVGPLEMKMEEWKKVAGQLDKDHAKEYKKARADIKKKSSDTIKLQKKVKKGKGEARGQLDSALQDVNSRYAVLEETEKRAVCRALIEERARFCGFVSMLRPVLDHEINMLGEVTHLQTIMEDLSHLTADPHKLPPASEQVILDLNCSDYNYSYQTPPASPSNSLSRKSSVSSTYQSVSVRHVPSLDSISAVDGVHMQRLHLIGREEESCGRSLSEGNSPSRLRGRLARYHGNRPSPGRPGYALSAATAAATGPAPNNNNYNNMAATMATSYRRVSRRDLTHRDPMGSMSQLYIGGSENGSHTHLYTGERARAMSASGKSCSARDQLALTLGALNSDAPRSSRDSLHCSSGYSTQTTTPSCSEDPIHTHSIKRDPPIYVDYDSISLHGDADTLSLRQVSLHTHSLQSDLDKSSTMPRNSDLGLQYKRFAQSKRPASTASLLVDQQELLIGGSVRQLASHTATIRRKPSSKPAYRRGTISGVPIPISTPQVPMKALAGTSSCGSDESVYSSVGGGGGGMMAPPGGGFNTLHHCTSTQSLSALPHHSTHHSSIHSSIHSSHHPPSPSPYYQLVPGQMPVPVAAATTTTPPPPLYAELDVSSKQQQQQYHHDNQQQLIITNSNNQHQQPMPMPMRGQSQSQSQSQGQLPWQQNQQEVVFKHPQSHLRPPHPTHMSQQTSQQLNQYQQSLILSQQQRQKMFHQKKNQEELDHPGANFPPPIPVLSSVLGLSAAADGYPVLDPPPPTGLNQISDPNQVSNQIPNPNQVSNQAQDEAMGSGDMLTRIRSVKLKRTLTNDRSAPMLPPPPPT